MLIDMLKQNPSFDALPIEKKEVIAKLAYEFEDNDFALYLDPKELADKLGVGSKQQWQEFLNIEQVRQYVNAQMANAAQVASRKTFMGLLNQGMNGNVQAIKEINELSGVMNSGDKNKVIVLHQIQRPKVVRRDA
jgi:hypothetical protein